MKCCAYKSRVQFEVEDLLNTCVAILQDNVAFNRLDKVHISWMRASTEMSFKIQVRWLSVIVNVGPTFELQFGESWSRPLIYERLRGLASHLLLGRYHTNSQ